MNKSKVWTEENEKVTSCGKNIDAIRGGWPYRFTAAGKIKLNGGIGKKTLHLREMETKTKSNRFKMLKSVHKWKPNKFHGGKLTCKGRGRQRNKGARCEEEEQWFFLLHSWFKTKGTSGLCPPDVEWRRLPHLSDVEWHRDTKGLTLSTNDAGVRENRHYMMSVFERTDVTWHWGSMRLTSNLSLYLQPIFLTNGWRY